MAASIVILGFWVVGTRVGFSMPLDLRAHSIFRVTPVRGDTEYLRARRPSLLVLSALPAPATLLLSIWPWRPAPEHMVVLALLVLGCSDSNDALPGALAVAARWRTLTNAEAEEPGPQFEDEPSSAILVLGLGGSGA